MTHSILAGAACALLLALGSTTAAQAHTSSFKAVLTGGDLDASGVALVTVDYDTNVLTYDVTFSNLSALTAAHIHSGAAGVNGPVVVPFAVPEGLSGSGHFAGTVTGNPNALFITELTAPNFYVNVHTVDFPGGAIRGQLAAVPEPESLALMLAGLGVVGWSAAAAARRRA